MSVNLKHNNFTLIGSAYDSAQAVSQHQRTYPRKRSRIEAMITPNSQPPWTFIYIQGAIFATGHSSCFYLSKSLFPGVQSHYYPRIYGAVFLLQMLDVRMSGNNHERDCFRE